MTNTLTLRTSLNPAPRARALLLTGTATLAVLIASTAAHAARDRAPRCGGGFFVVQGQPLVASSVASDAIIVGTAGASTLSGCPNVPAQVRPGKRADRLIVRWPACGDVRRVTLRASVAGDCRTISGVVKAKGKPRRRFTAHAGMPGNGEPWDPAITPLPDGAEIVDPATFVELSRQPGFRTITPHDRADEEAAAAAEDEANRAVIEQFLAEHPERADLMPIGVAPDAVPTGDGNYAVTIRDADGNASTVVTMGPRYERAVLADTIRRFPTRENQLAIYAQRYELANATLGLELPTPEQAAALSDEEITALNAEVADRHPLAEAGAPAPGESAPAWYPGSCRFEIGAGDGTDMLEGGVCEHTRNGLWKTASWPLKYYDTCVKNQRTRGACAAFAITAGLELQVAQKYDRWINLSEQHLYSAAKTEYQQRTFGDGLNTGELTQQLFDARYEQPLEERWDYNPSNSRITIKETSTYRDSCVGYTAAESAYCSDTAGQARLVCVQVGSVYDCARLGAPVSGVTVRSTSMPTELWDPGKPDQFGNLYLALLEKRPVVLSLYATTSFRNPDPDGFVEYDPETAKWCPYESDGETCIQGPDCQCSSATHAVLAVGYVKNEDLPETAPKGLGGGWVVIKNSWGCTGDGGYYYLPVNWVKRFVFSARALGDVETSAPLPDQPVQDLRFNFEPVPPAIHIVQPSIFERYVAGQQVPLVIDGADFQFDGYALNGETRWSSDIQGPIGTGTRTHAMLAQGWHQLTATYTGKTGAEATDTIRVLIGPRPADVPPTAYFIDVTLTRTQCPVYCPGACVLARGYGDDVEDGILSSDANVSWSTQLPNGTSVPSGTGASVGNEPKYLGCIAGCGGLHTFTLDVQDSAGQHAFARREIFTPACVN